MKPVKGRHVGRLTLPKIADLPSEAISTCTNCRNRQPPWGHKIKPLEGKGGGLEGRPTSGKVSQPTPKVGRPPTLASHRPLPPTSTPAPLTCWTINRPVELNCKSVEEVESYILP